MDPEEIRKKKSTPTYTYLRTVNNFKFENTGIEATFHIFHNTGSFEPTLDLEIVIPIKGII
jgi:hypothetical protein